ncbi:MAG: DUF4031 domain-containing protein [Pseudomonadota bacterium]
MVYTDRQRLTADYIEELVEFGKALGLGLNALRDFNTTCKHTHFNIGFALHTRAIRRGAIVVSREAFVVHVYQMRREGERKIFAEPGADSAGALQILDSRTGQTELL